VTEVESITPRELQQRLASGEELLVLDVREDDELEICRLEGAVHIPMSELSVRISELDPDAPVVCVCHHGIRSASVATALVGLDFDRVLNLTGGIDRWAAEVDPSMARY
jgi:rhodanese-related sulfurtransferase